MQLNVVVKFVVAELGCLSFDLVFYKFYRFFVCKMGRRRVTLRGDGEIQIRRFMMSFWWRLLFSKGQYIFVILNVEVRRTYFMLFYGFVWIYVVDQGDDVIIICIGRVSFLFVFCVYGIEVGICYGECFFQASGGQRVNGFVFGFSFCCFLSIRIFVFLQLGFIIGFFLVDFVFVILTFGSFIFFLVLFIICCRMRGFYVLMELFFLCS